TRPARAAREVQSRRHSQGQAVRRPEGVGLRLRRAAGRRPGPAARALPQRERLHHRHAGAERGAGRASPGAGHRLLGVRGAVHGLERQPGHTGGAGRGDRPEAERHRPRRGAGARVQRSAAEEPVPASAGGGAQSARERAEPPRRTSLRRHRVRGAADAAGQPARGLSAGGRARLPQRHGVGEIARLYQQKGDTLKAIGAFIHELQGEPQNTQLRLGIAELLRQQKQYQQAVRLLDDGLVHSASDPKLADLKQRICLEGELWRCVVDGFVKTLTSDSAKQSDSTFLKAAIGAAQQISDTTNLLLFARAASRHFPQPAPFWEALGTTFDLKGQRDSSVWAYKQAFAADPNRLKTALLIAKAIVDGTVYDTAHAPPKS